MKTVTLYTDGACSGNPGPGGWKKKNWIKSDKKPALNPDLWDVLLQLTMKHEVHYHWVKGHATNPKNNRCDELAVSEWKKLK